MKRRYRVLTAVLLAFIMISAVSGCGMDADATSYQIWEPLESKDNTANGDADKNSPGNADGT